MRWAESLPENCSDLLLQDRVAAVPKFRVKHLMRRNGAFGGREINVSLRTRRFDEAAAAGATGTLAFRRLCATLRVMKTVTEDDVRRMVQRFHATRLASSAPLSAMYGAMQERTKEWNTEHAIAGLEALVRGEDFEQPDTELKEEASPELRAAIVSYVTVGANKAVGSHGWGRPRLSVFR